MTTEGSYAQRRAMACSSWHPSWPLVVDEQSRQQIIWFYCRARVNLDEPRYNQTAYCGRAKHFFIITNPLNIFATNKDLDRAKELVTNTELGKMLETSLKMNYKKQKSYMIQLIQKLMKK